MPEVSVISQESQLINGFGDTVRQRIMRETSLDVESLKALMATLELQRASLMERRRPIDDALARNATEISATQEILLTQGCSSGQAGSGQQPAHFAAESRKGT